MNKVIDLRGKKPFMYKKKLYFYRNKVKNLQELSPRFTEIKSSVYKNDVRYLEDKFIDILA